MTGRDTSELKASLATIAADLEAKQKANAEREAEAYLAKLVNRRTVCLALAGLFCTVAVILSLGYWTGKIHVPVGTISWLGPGLTTFSLLGAIALQQNIYQRRNAARQDRIEEGMRTNCAKVVTEIRDARPADAIELGRLVAYMQGVEERIPVAVEDAVRKAHASGFIRDLIADVVEDAARKGYATGYTDALATVGSNGRSLRSVPPQT